MSNNKLDKLIIVDLEATCWANKKEQGDQVSEIIEIGACFLDLKTMKPEFKRSYLVKPKFSKISKFCSELTSITPDMIKYHGVAFIDAVDKFKKDFVSKHRTWLSWGAYDKIMMEKNCKLYNIKYPMSINYINAKNLYSIHRGLKKELGMMKALRHSGIKHEGVHHRGDDDAWNIAKLISSILK